MRAGVLALVAMISASASAFQAANTISTPQSQKKSLNDQLHGIRGRIVQLQGALVESLRGQQRAQENMVKVRKLIELQREEKALSARRLQEFEKTVVELESRREVLKAKIKAQRSLIARSLKSLDQSLRSAPLSTRDERIEAPRRKVLANLADRGVREIEVFRADLSDADQLESRILEERSQMAYLIQDLEEQESVLELNKQLQSEFFQKNRQERIAQLEKYKRLKDSEAQVESLISQFSARVELEKSADQEVRSQASLAPPASEVPGSFLSLRGKLRLPISQGQVVSQFGKVYDAESKLHVFKKGIEINTSGSSAPVGHGGSGKKVPVQSVAAGKVAYAGALPDYGNVTIVEHGDHYYTLFAKLGEVLKKPGDAVAAGELLGQTADDGTPLYFEIRSRNVAVNPLQWLTN